MAYSNIKQPNLYFNTKLYTGTGSEQSISLDYSPDFVWVKDRGANSHRLFDNVRGATKILYSDLNFAEATDAQTLKSFDSNGFTLGTNADVNGSGNNFVSWSWRSSDSSAVANTDGSISSTVSANTTSGFSIVSFTGTGANATVGHGLGVAPKVLILKSRTRSDGEWTVGSDMLTWSKFLFLNQTSAEQTFNLYQNTAPTSSVFYLSGDGGVNQSGGSMIGYAFAEKQGFSKFGSYTGNGSTDGTFVYTGFKPAFIMTKRTDGADWWVINDTKRDTFNASTLGIRPNDSAAESSDDAWTKDILSNGFKHRTANNGSNGSGASYIYMAFAEQPLVGDNPATAR